VVPLVFKTSLGAVRSLEGSTPSLLRQIGDGALFHRYGDSGDRACDRALSPESQYLWKRAPSPYTRSRFGRRRSYPRSRAQRSIVTLARSSAIGSAMPIFVRSIVLM
jgi:hypothetical protein